MERKKSNIIQNISGKLMQFPTYICSSYCNEFIILKFHWPSYSIRLELWCLTPLSAMFSYILAVSFTGGVTLRTREKTTDLSKVRVKLYHILLYRVHLAWGGFELTTLMVALIAYVAINPTTIRSQPRRPLLSHRRQHVKLSSI
jgi:hypothetical protein